MTPREIASFFERMTPADLDRLHEVYAPEARFKDPFNEVTGLPAIRRVYAHMYEALDTPRFVVHEVIADGPQCVLTWDFRFRFRRFRDGEQVVRGASHLRLDGTGRVVLHRDYWDAAEELYEKLPALGGLMRWLRRRAGAA